MKSSKPCKPSKLSKLRKQMNKEWKALKEDLISNNRTWLSKPSKLSIPWKYNKRRKTGKHCKPSKLRKPRKQMDDGGKIRYDIKPEKRSCSSKPGKLSKPYKNEGSLPCTPSKLDIWISPLNQRAKVNLANHVNHGNC